MIKNLSNYLLLLALASFVGAVFQIADNHFLIGIVLIGAGAYFTFISAAHKKKYENSGLKGK